MNRWRAARRRIPARCRRGRGRARLAYAVGVREALVGLELAGSDRGHVSIEIVDEDRHHGVARAAGVLHDEDRPVFGKRPHRLSGVGEERRLAEQPLIPRSGRLEVPHAHTREEMQRHRRESRSRGGYRQKPPDARPWHAEGAAIVELGPGRQRSKVTGRDSGAGLRSRPRTDARPREPVLSRPYPGPSKKQTPGGPTDPQPRRDRVRGYR